MISGFKDENRWLSNFWPAEVYVPYLAEGDAMISVPTVEHGYVVMKSGCWKAFRRQTSIELREYQRSTPGQVKRMGRAVILRPDWEEVKVDVMSVLLEQKFAPGTDLAQKLLETGNQLLIEANTWHDNFWGICTCTKCRRKHAWGGNHLGHLLQEIRKNLREV